MLLMEVFNMADKVVTYKYKYKAELFFVNTEKNKSTEIEYNNIKSFTIDHDYESNNMPTIYMNLALDKALIDSSALVIPSAKELAEPFAILETPLTAFTICPPAISIFIAPTNGLLVTKASAPLLALLVEKIVLEITDGINDVIAKPDVMLKPFPHYKFTHYIYIKFLT